MTLTICALGVTELERDVHTWVATNDLKRVDGHVYAVDIAQLMVHASLVRDRALYETLHARAVRDFFFNTPKDTMLDGIVAWRSTREASGTTEALRFVEALWRGAAIFQRPHDRDLALKLLDAYARHAQIDRGTWFIANYLNIGQRTFATNSYLVDYDPDLLSAIASTRPEFGPLATASRALVVDAVAPSGLIYDIVQPEVATLMPHFEQRAFSPNDVVQVANSCTVAERAVRVAPAVGRGVIAFVKPRIESLKLAYYGRDGAPAAADSPGVQTYACIVRLAKKLGDEELVAKARVYFDEALRRWMSVPEEPHVYTASEALMTLHVLESGASNADAGGRERK